MILGQTGEEGLEWGREGWLRIRKLGSEQETKRMNILGLEGGRFY